MENITKMMMDAPQPEIDADLFGKFVQQIRIWDYSSISREGFIAISNFEKENLIRNYYLHMKSRGSGKFDIIFFIMPNRQQFKSMDSVKLVWMQVESKVMQGCFYCGKCEKW